MYGSGRGLSGPLGIALLFAIVTSGMLVVVGLGATAVDDTRDRMDVGRAEKALTQFDSKSAMVALGQTNRQRVSLARSDGASYRVREGAGWMNVTVTNGTSGETATIVNATLGAVVYERGEQSLVYQGGGVWKETESGSTMVSPPEFHYRDATLTLPIVSVDGSPTLGSSGVVTKGGPTRVRYPNATADTNFTNPLASGRVNVTVHSEHYEAWGRFFTQRTDGNVSYDHAREVARIELVVPFDEEYDNVVATTEPGGVTMNGNDPAPEPSETGVSYPPADDRIENRIADCESDSTACTDVSGDVTIDSGGTYYADSYFSGTVDVNSPGDDVTLVVNENFSPDGVTIDSEHNTTILVRNSFDMNSNDYINAGGEAGNLSVVVHSDGAVNGNGNYKFVGLLYAPGSDCNLNGGGSTSPNVVGGVVCDTVTFNGNPHDYSYDSSIRSTQLDLGGEITPITYLHVTTNPVNVTSP